MLNDEQRLERDNDIAKEAAKAVFRDALFHCQFASHPPAATVMACMYAGVAAHLAMACKEISVDDQQAALREALDSAFDSVHNAIVTSRS